MGRNCYLRRSLKDALQISKWTISKWRQRMLFLRQANELLEQKISLMETEVSE